MNMQQLVTGANKYSEKTCHRVTFCNTNLTQPDLDRTRAAAVESWRLTVGDMTRPCKTLQCQNLFIHFSENIYH
jgi:hypothetical protein